MVYSSTYQRRFVLAFIWLWLNKSCDVATCFPDKATTSALTNGAQARSWFGCRTKASQDASEVTTTSNTTAASLQPSNDRHEKLGVNKINSEEASHHVELSASSSSNCGWSGMFAVDPAKIVSTLIKNGGLLIPDKDEDDFRRLHQICHVDKAELNLIERNLILYNFCVSMPSSSLSAAVPSKPRLWRRFTGRLNRGKSGIALRIGRVYIHWDSYFQPCMYVEVDDVEIWLEFCNVLLTRSNWSEVEEFLYPKPGNPMDKKALQHQKEPRERSDALLRFGSIDLSGDMILRISSRPLNRELGVLKVDMDLLDELNFYIQKRSIYNHRVNNRRGCTLEDISNVCQKYLGKKAKSLASNWAKDLVASSREALEGAGEAIKEADGIVYRVRDSLLDYAEDVGRRTAQFVHVRIHARTTERTPADVLHHLVERSLERMSRVRRRSMLHGSPEKIRRGGQPIHRDFSAADRTTS